VTVQVARIEGFDVVVPTRSEALFAAGSISKFVTALGALLLVDRGVLELDADVRGTTMHAPPPRVCERRRGISPVRMTVPQADVPHSSDLDAIRELGLAPPEEVGLGVFLAAGGTRFGHLGGAYGFTSAFDVSATDGTGVVVMSDVHNGFGVVLPQVVETLAVGVSAPVGTWRA
jgi:hypothetical protein